MIQLSGPSGEIGARAARQLHRPVSGISHSLSLYLSLSSVNYGIKRNKVSSLKVFRVRSRKELSGKKGVIEEGTSEGY